MGHCRPGLLSRLRRDIKGNTLAIVGAGLVPLTAIIGSGVDMSRAYMAKTRLQSACDAAALAGRRVMQNDTLTQSVTDEATRFFAFNFPQGLYNTASFTPSVTRPESGTVRVAAATTIPTAVMRIFGFTSLPLEVNCDATLSFVNTDVMLVLDVTGSMAWDINNNTTGDPSARKIAALREAVMALYDELAPIQTQLEANGLRLRYGVVPYSSTVNVGTLIRDANAGHLSSDSEFETRVAVYDTPATWTQMGTPGAPVTQISGSSLTQSECDLYGRNLIDRGPTWSAGPPEWVRTYSNNEASGVDWGWSGSGDTGGSRRACRRRYVQIPADVTSWGFTAWSYEAENVDTSAYKTGSAVTIATDDPGGTVPESGRYDMVELPQVGTGIATTTAPVWNGCIEERDTVDTITATSGYTAPANAFDLDVNLIPHDDATRWRPMFPHIVYRRTAGATSATSGTLLSSTACPATARRLQAWNRTAMESYVNALQPTGSTYHDIGMIWGARMLSNAGIFADSPDTFAGMPVSRHIIFMTDGQMDTDNGIYAFHSIERNAQRVSGQPSPSESELNGRHMQRFKMACNAARNQGASIWVIAFGTTLTSQMIECASNPNQAFTSANRDQLIARFREIGANIGALRLTQ